MKPNVATRRQQQIQLLRLRCQLERKQLQLQALDIQTDYAMVNEIGGQALKFKYFPLLIGVASAGILLLRPKRCGTFIRTGIKLWGMWQRFSPFIALIRSRLDTGNNDQKNA